MLAPSPILPESLSKTLEFIQDNKTYKIDIFKKEYNIIFSIKDTNKIEEYFTLEISYEEIQNKNPMLRIYKNIEELINSIEQFIINKNISLTENNNSLILNLFIFNIMNGNKEKVSFELNKKQNDNKDEIIKSLCLKVNNLEDKYNKLNEKYEKIMKFIEPMMKAAEEEEKNFKYKFQWENHYNCQLSNNNKILKKIKNDGWNTNVKGNKILKKNSINIFKIKVNSINNDKSGLSFGLAKISSDFSDGNLFQKDWNLNCGLCNSKFNSFLKEGINAGDIITFTINLIKGTLSIKKNNTFLGELRDIPKDEDLVPCVCTYFVGDEVEIIE